MSYQVDPRILSKLQAFARRRRKLIIIRGICSALAMLLATMMIVALVDWVFVLPDEARWALSAAAYLAVLFVEWRTCLRQLTHAPDARQLARLIEHAEPKLREDLLSAVELGTAEGETVFDSAQFRGLLQADVAHRVEGMEVDRLLPANLLKRYIGVAVALSVAVLIAFIATGFQFSTLMLRALFPGMNLGRVSATQVAVLQPKPAERIVAHGDALPLEIQLSGRLASKAVLEVFTKGGKRQVVPLTAVGPDRFAGTVQVGREDVRYRVRAGDAITRKYLLDAEPRPHVIEFEKTFTPPAYTKLPPTTRREENGDLVGLEGSEIELKLTTNVPIGNAELRLEQGKSNTFVPLVPGPDGKLRARLPLKISGAYRVHLVAARTAFENKFSPEYELRAEPDLVPGVTLDVPQQDLIVPANEIVEFLGTATDDLGVARLAQLFKVNEGAWSELPVPIAAGAKVSFHHRWDLLQQGLKAGDMVTAKIVAHDLKGNKGESRPVQISVTAAGFEMKRLAALDAHRALGEALTVWREAAEALAKVSGETRQRIESTGEDPARQSQLAIFAEAYVEFEQRHGEAISALSSALRAADAGHESSDLVLVGRLLAKAEAGTARTSKISNAVAAHDLRAPFVKALVQEADDAANRTVQRARGLEESFRTLLTAEEFDLFAENIQVLNREHQRLARLAQNSGAAPAKWAPLAMRFRVLLVETKTLEEALMKTGGSGRSANERAKPIANQIRKQREALEKMLGDKSPHPALLAPTLNLAKAIEEAMRGILALKTDLGDRPIEVARALRTEVQPTWTNFERHRADLKLLANNQELTAETRDALATGRWSARSDLFKTHGDLEEIRPASDASFVADVRAATVALEGFQALAPTDGPEKTGEKLTQLDLAFRLLEGGHDLQEMLDGLIHLAANERWQIISPRARTANPRDWNWLEARLKLAPDELGRLQLTAEPVREAISGAQKILSETPKNPSWAQIAREMQERRHAQRDPITVRPDVEAVAAEVKRALALLRPHMDAARQQVAELAPKLSELAAALAKETKALKEETHRQEEAAKEKAPEETKEEAAKTLAKQESLNEKLEPLKDLLRADANQQNILEPAERDRARDADDALAMLKEPPPKAEAALEDAAKAETASAREQALAQAAEQQQKLESALNQIAQHFEHLEKGESPVETRSALRAAEQELGIKEQLDAQFAKAEQLAQMAQKTPEELLAQLERALPKNPLMQQELSSISQAALAEAERKLDQASKQENQVAENLQRSVQQEQQGPPPQAAAKAQEAAKQAAQAAEAAKVAANNAVQAAKKVGNEKATTEARLARQEATEAAQAAQQAAQSAEQMAKATQPQQAAQAAQQTAQRASQAAQAAQKAAVDANDAQAAAEQAAQKAGEKQAGNQEVAQQSGEAMKAAEQAAKSALEAQAAAEAVQSAMAQNQPAPGQSPEGVPPGAMPSQLAQAAQQQQPIGQMTAEAGANVARAGRHEARLQNSPAGEQLQQLGGEIGETAMAEVPAAQRALEAAANPAQAQAPVNAARTELAAELAQLQKATQGGESPPAGASPQSPNAPPAGSPPSPGAPSPPSNAPSLAGQTAPSPSPGSTPPSDGEPSPGTPGAGELANFPASPLEQQWMARTLDALDAALNGPTSPAQANAAGQQPGQNAAPSTPPQPGQPGQPGPPSPSSAQSAMTAAAQAAQAQMRAQRSQSVSPTPAGFTPQGDQQEKSEGGTLAQAPAQGYGAVPDAKNLRAGEWGKLPKKMAEQLTKGQQEGIAPEYRGQVQTYYRVIAERAKKP